MARLDHEEVDVVIIGGGPASLILSYILHGHIPYYVGKHQDALLDSKLQQLKDLLHIQPHVYSHFGSSLRYSQQAQPINALLDTLVRPNADTEIDPPSHIEWRHEPERAISHVVLTQAARAGGQWSRCSSSRSDDIGALSYAEMLSLPGYSFRQHYRKQHGEFPPDLIRPSRTLVASYYAAYPAAVGIAGTIRTDSKVTNVSRLVDGFLVEPMRIKCRQLVLATGIFTHNIAPPPLLLPVQSQDEPSLPLLVVGSGFSAADSIIAAPPNRKILHLFKWAPAEHPSPLRGCHHQAYPEYAGVYRQMKAASSQHAQIVSPMLRRKTNPFFKQRDWSTVYEGLPNATITRVTGLNRGLRISISCSKGTTIERDVGGLAYRVGRRGSLAYLDPALLAEVLGYSPSRNTTSNGTSDVEAEHVSENSSSSKYLRRGGTRNGGALVAHDVYAIGSLTGDSLVRHAFGVCVDAARIIMAWKQSSSASHSPAGTPDGAADQSCAVVDPLGGGAWLSECGAREPLASEQQVSRPSSSHLNGRAHDDLHVDRRVLVKHGH